jgi:subtilisin family serine protease
MPGAPDVFGHGTAVASVIADLVPDARLIVYKVAGDDGSAAEWDVIAGLLTVADADVVNLSLQFSHSAAGGRCRCCGHNAGASRSIVFEKAIAALLRGDRPPVVVAAAGNSSANSLAYPARFAACVAVGSLNASRQRSSFSNYGATDETLHHHPNLFFLPGGDSTTGHEESVASSANVPLHFWGTSFACAYASGIAAVLRTYLSAAHAVAHLRATAVPDVAHFTPGDHGNGRMVLA